MLAWALLLALGPFSGAPLPDYWEVRNGELHAMPVPPTTQPTDLYTPAKYRDFELTFEFKLGSKASTGIRYMVVPGQDEFAMAARRIFLLLALVAALGLAVSVLVVIHPQHGWARRPLALLGIGGFVVLIQMAVPQAGWNILSPAVTGLAACLAALILPGSRLDSFAFRTPFLVLALLNLALLPFIWGRQRAIQETYVKRPLALEFQLASPGHRELERGPLYQPGGLYGMLAPLNPATFKEHEWHTGRLVVNGKRVEHWIDGKQTLTFELGGPQMAEGRRNYEADRQPFPRMAPKAWARLGDPVESPVGLQHHSEEVWFRNLELR